MFGGEPGPEDLQFRPDVVFRPVFARCGEPRYTVSAWELTRPCGHFTCSNCWHAVKDEASQPEVRFPHRLRDRLCTWLQCTQARQPTSEESI